MWTDDVRRLCFVVRELTIGMYRVKHHFALIDADHFVKELAAALLLILHISWPIFSRIFISAASLREALDATP